MAEKIKFFRAMVLMLIGNVFTTIIGLIVAILLGSGGIGLLGGLIVWPICVPPARRVLATTNRKWLKGFSGAGLAGIMTLAFIISCFLFAVSYFDEDPSNHLAVHWVLKLMAIYVALITSIVMTAFWEEWVVWKISRNPPQFTGYVQPVIGANLAVLLIVMLYAAAVMLPQRLKSPHFLVQLYSQAFAFHIQSFTIVP